MTSVITRDEIMTRATMAPWLPETVQYDMEVSPEFPTGADCSAYVTWCWNVSGDYNTVTLLSAGIMKEIPFSDVQRGDAMGHCGPNTGGADGHIQLFDRWEDLNAGTYWCWQQNGVGLGPHYDLETLPDNYRAYTLTTGIAVANEENNVYTKRDGASGSVWVCDGIHRRGVPHPAAWAALQAAGIPHRGDLVEGEDIAWHGVLVGDEVAGVGMTADQVAAELGRRLSNPA